MAPRDAAAPARRPTAGAWAALVLAELTVAVLAVVRWTGQPPFGSDNDEYRMLADALWSSGRPLIAGVEGTKYPFGWSLLVGALDRVGLDATWAPQMLNVVLVAATVAVVWHLARRWGALAAATAGIAVAAGASLWSAVYVVMPDAALTFVVSLGLWWLATLDDGRRHLATGTALAAAAVLLKTAGLVLAGALTLALLLRPASRRWSWLPVTVGLALTGLQSLLVAPYPEHTTGYAATFWLRNPYDAAAGRIGVAELPARMLDRLDVVWADVVDAVLGVHVPDRIGIAVSLVLVAAGVVAVRRWRLPVAAFVLAHVALFAAWPFRSARFGLPLIPLAAVGLAAVVGVTRRRAGAVVAAVLAVALLVPHVAGNLARARSDAAAERVQLAELHATTDELAAWLDAHVPADERIASLDYRELAHHTGRTVLPLAYTTDTEALLAASAGRDARWLIVLRGLYGRREARADALRSAYPERFEPVHTTGRADVYRILPGGDAP